ncbi:MAG: hypothetical protein L0312_29460 [Acidobacteria bacterium]|nr:hypothetical protein [Acidobacteriota bacterium]
MSTDVTARVTVGVEVSCEGCGYSYSYEALLIGSASSWSDTQDEKTLTTEATNELTGKVDACRSGRHLGVKKCPKCSHIQSWMRQDQTENRSMASGIIGVVLGVASTVAIYNYRAALGIEQLWSWLSLPALVAFSIGYYKLLKFLWVARVPAPSVRSHPSRVSVLRTPEVEVKTTEYH